MRGRRFPIVREALSTQTLPQGFGGKWFGSVVRVFVAASFFDFNCLLAFFGLMEILLTRKVKTQPPRARSRS
jgi:hypothetical protein